MDLALDLAGIYRTVKPQISSRVIVTLAADHGVAATGVSKYPPEVTCQMVRNFVSGGAGVNALARATKTDVVIVDMGVAGDLSDLEKQEKIISRSIGQGTANMLEGPAMSPEQAVASIEAGIEIALKLGVRYDIFGTGEMGIGNTTPSSAIVSLMTGLPVDAVTGRGTGIDDGQFDHKISVIEKALNLNKPNPSDPIDVLAKVGGYEIGAIAGLILAAASMGKAVIIDGFITTAGALLAQSICPLSAEYMIAAHKSVEVGHQAALAKLGKKPLLDLEMRLGEGTGAALAMSLIEASSRILTEVSTFEEAAVSKA
jgi:nicotinate-nucleotide--dimethylbenzimidazole phosphoribosyltransferase